MKTLKKSREFKRVVESGDREIMETITIYRAPNQTESTRIGISVSRKIGKSARRNKLKRRIREAARKNASFLPYGEDIVIVARRRITGASFSDIERDIRGLCEGKTSENEGE